MFSSLSFNSSPSTSSFSSSSASSFVFSSCTSVCSSTSALVASTVLLKDTNKLTLGSPTRIRKNVSKLI
ncbi:unnamed protein product [Arabidopsis halleri]